MKCSECRWYAHQIGAKGLCRRYPPTVTHFPNGRVDFVRPVVYDNDFCGEFSAQLDMTEFDKTDFF